MYLLSTVLYSQFILSFIMLYLKSGLLKYFFKIYCNLIRILARKLSENYETCHYQESICWQRHNTRQSRGNHVAATRVMSSWCGTAPATCVTAPCHMSH
jgi:hypothetical protein